MTNLKGFVERRRYKRFKAKEEIVAEFHKARLFRLLKPVNPRLVKSIAISEISFGGLRFEYTLQSMWSVDFDTLSISTASGEIRIDNLPFQAVTDCSIARLQDSKSVRKCCVKFGELTSEQQSKLYDFIQKHSTSDHAIDRRSGTNRRRMNDAQYSGIERREKVERRKTRLRDSK